ncbi:hypothetical protein [Caenimonas koreensis]|uniref:nuclear transport factor 2 family protein n=1 Tax=Caenimonas koreensis TaxID=367474 RepID=UPI0037837ACF
MSRCLTRWIRPITGRVFKVSLLAGCSALVACSSNGGASSTRDLEVQAAAASSRAEANRATARVEPTRDGRLSVVTDGWGRAVPPPPNVIATIPGPTTAPARTAAQPVAQQPAQPVAQPAAVSAPIGSPRIAAASPIAPPNPEVAWRRTLEDWRSAWARGDIDAYLSAYDPQFKGTFATRAQWEAQRRERLANRSIELTLDDMRVIRATADEADLRFIQHYRSNQHVDDGLKHVQLRRSGTQWKIVAEAWIKDQAAGKPARKSLAKQAP